MAIQLGQIAPDFELDSTAGRIRFYKWLGSSWALLISDPKRLTRGGSTDLEEVAKLRSDWERHGVKPIKISVDAIANDHQSKTDAEYGHNAASYPPMTTDADAEVSKLYGAFHTEDDPAVAVRSVFVIDPAKTVRHIHTYRPSAAESAFAEILGIIKRLQLADAFDPVI